MVRFSCFHSSVHCPKPKKTVQMSTEAMHKTLEDYSENQPKKDVAISTEVPEEPLSNGDDTNPSPSSIVQDWKSEGFKSVNDTASDDGTPKIRQMRKSLSMGSVLVGYKEKTSADDCSLGESSSSHNNHSGSRVQVDDKDPGIHKADSLELSSNMVNHESVFSLGYQQQSEKEVCENSETRFSGEGTGYSSSHTPPTPHTIAKSGSLPYLRSSLSNIRHQSRSSEDLKALDLRRKDRSISNVETQVSQDQERDDHVGNIDKNNAENPADDSDDAYQFVGSAKDWIVPAVDELSKGKNVQEDYSVCRWEELPNKDFKIKRIEKWVTDLQHCPLEETNAQTNSNHHGRNDNDIGLDVLTTSKVDGKAVIGMDAAKRYISSLSASATAAQLTNHGLVVIPFLSAFSSLKALNLSGNAIMRITAGALPRGLHILNLSKNSISTIEGLRDLTRLRVLDLSYNRILRIGHGLASCSSLKELYLAGNKISEVEGLHRLLKLNVLDLRFNKLSTTKSLGQLAANYNSLQAISLEGNPAQKNIGDEHLKKYLLSLLPHLAYFNRQSIKAGSTKDSADRAARLGISAHQIDRGLRSDSKTLRKSAHGRKNQPVASRSKHVRLPPAGIKTTIDRQHFNDLSSKLFSFRPDALRRTRSEEVLGAI